MPTLKRPNILLLARLCSDQSLSYFPSGDLELLALLDLPGLRHSFLPGLLDDFRPGKIAISTPFATSSFPENAFLLFALAFGRLGS